MANNIVEYSDIMAFHPGYYVAEIVDDMGITQEEFATRLGTTPKTLSKLINGQINLSNDIAKKLSSMLGSSVNFWLNLQKAYEEKIIEIEQKRDLEEQAEIARMIDYSYFEKVADLPSAHSIYEKVTNLCRYFIISNLKILQQPDFLVNYRSGTKTTNDKNIVNAQAWLQTSLNYAQNIATAPYDSDKLKSYLPEIRSMTLQEPNEFLPRLSAIFSECGIAFVFLPHLKNSGINGAVKWISKQRVVLAMNDRRNYADTFWFSLFHEIKHVLQQKINTVFISSTSEEKQNMNAKFETEADEFSRNCLIPAKDFKKFVAPDKYISDAEIVAFAKSIGINPGIVVGRLQYEGIIPQYRCSALKKKYNSKDFEQFILNL